MSNLRQLKLDFEVNLEFGDQSFPYVLRLARDATASGLFRELANITVLAIGTYKFPRENDAPWTYYVRSTSTNSLGQSEMGSSKVELRDLFRKGYPTDLLCYAPSPGITDL